MLINHSDIDLYLFDLDGTILDTAKEFHLSLNVLLQQKELIEKEFISMTSMNTWVYEEDIGKMCSFLISDDSLRISGQIISIDGDTLRMH